MTVKASHVGGDRTRNGLPESCGGYVYRGTKPDLGTGKDPAKVTAGKAGWAAALAARQTCQTCGGLMPTRGRHHCRKVAQDGNHA